MRKGLILNCQLYSHTNLPCGQLYNNINSPQCQLCSHINIPSRQLYSQINSPQGQLHNYRNRKKSSSQQVYGHRDYLPVAQRSEYLFINYGMYSVFRNLDLRNKNPQPKYQMTTIIHQTGNKLSRVHFRDGTGVSIKK